MDYYPSSPYDAMDTPLERQEDEQKEQAFITSSIPVIQEVLDWLEKAADEYRNIDSYNVTVETPPDKAIVVLAYSAEMRQRFLEKKGEFENQFADYLEKE